MKNYQKISIYPSVPSSCMTNEVIPTEYMKTDKWHLKMLILELHLNPWFKWSSTNKNASCISSTTSYLHAIFMHHIVAYACVWLSAPFFSIGPAPETDPEYLSEEQCSARCFTRQANPLVHSDTIPLSLLLPVIALGQQRLQLLLYAVVVEPIPLHDLSFHSK